MPDLPRRARLDNRFPTCQSPKLPAFGRRTSKWVRVNCLSHDSRGRRYQRGSKIAVENRDPLRKLRDEKVKRVWESHEKDSHSGQRWLNIPSRTQSDAAGGSFMAHQYLSSSFRSHALALTVWMVSPLFIECDRPSIAEEPEFSKHAASPDNPAFAEEKDHLGSSINPAFVEQKDNVDRSISPDGRYTASQERNSREIVAAHSVAVVVRSVDGKELFRIPTEGMGYARLSPTFSKNSKFLATHSIVNSNLGTIGMLNQLVVHRCSTGERLFESNLSLHPEVILFHDDWILVAGESRRPESKYCCQILRSDNGSEVSTLLLPDRSGLTAEFISFKKLEFDDSWIQAHAIITYGSIFGPVNSKSHVTYKWDGQRVLELSRQGEKIVAVGSKLNNMYSWDNTQAEPLAELQEVGGNRYFLQAAIPFRYRGHYWQLPEVFG